MCDLAREVFFKSPGISQIYSNSALTINLTSDLKNVKNWKIGWLLRNSHLNGAHDLGTP